MGPRGRTTLVRIGALALLLVACGGGSDSGTPFGLGGDLAVADIDVAGRTGVALNQHIEVCFSDEIDPSSVTTDTIRIRPASPEATVVPGVYHVDGDVVVFVPRPPNDPSLVDAGLQPGRDYTVEPPSSGNRTVRSMRGERLYLPVQGGFSTVDVGSPSLFRDERPGEAPESWRSRPQAAPTACRRTAPSCWK